MHTVQEYSNRDLDASLMVERLKAYRNVTTSDAETRLEYLRNKRAERIRNYKRVDTLEHELGDLVLLIQNRKQWSDFCFDDVSHWAGVV